MKEFAFRLICFILLITQISPLNFAQTNRESTNPQPTISIQQNMPMVCELKDFKTEQSLDYYEALLSLCRAEGNKAAIARILRAIAYIHSGEQKLGKSLEALLESQKISEDLGDTAATISALTAIGRIYTRQREFALALEYL